MRIFQRFHFILVACLGLAPVALLAGAETHWSEDYAASVVLSKAEKKPMLLLFTGSDWCPPCKMMEARVFASDDFAAFAKEKLVLIKADFPRRSPQEAAIKKQNRKLADQFEVEGFPTIVMLSPSGKVVGQFVGAQYATPKAFLGWARKVVKKS